MSEPDSESPIEARLVAQPASTTATAFPDSGKPAEGVFQSRGAVFAMLFLVTGVLGIPLLWVNRNFSQTERIIWSIIVTIYTAALVLVAAMIVLWSYRQIMGQ